MKYSDIKLNVTSFFRLPLSGNWFYCICNRFVRLPTLEKIMATITSTMYSLMWILMEAIQFAYMAYLIWRDRNDVVRRHRERIRASVVSA